MLVAVMFTGLAGCPTSPEADALTVKVGAVSVVLPVDEICPVVTLTVVAVKVALPVPLKLPVMLMVLLESLSEKLLLPAVVVSPSETVPALSVRVTLWFPVEDETLVAEVLAVTFPDVLPTARVSVVRVVPALEEPVTLMVPL